ncbi:MAG TPA: SGNH/GDSL hydrolase family protein [Thermoguttaceae bacterium]|nr:SGNH/GDSL hydrolase family protein [Thermoguttaceae bacterium]
MRWKSFALLCVLVVSAATAADGQSPATAKLKPPFAPVAEDAALPRVLLIGDSISIGYTEAVRELLAGKANVQRAPTNCGPTISGLDSLDAWLGDRPWDVIHFNWGLHDLKFIGDERQVPLDQYEKNLRTLVATLKKTGATLVWCSTTPVPEKSSPPRKNEDVLAYNAVAKTIMEEAKIAIDDLYGFALPQIEKIQRPSNVHFTPEGSKVLAKQVAGSIEKALGESK